MPRKHPLEPLALPQDVNHARSIQQQKRREFVRPRLVVAVLQEGNNFFHSCAREFVVSKRYPQFLEGEFPQSGNTPVVCKDEDSRMREEGVLGCWLDGCDVIRLFG